LAKYACPNAKHPIFLIMDIAFNVPLIAKPVQRIVALNVIPDIMSSTPNA
jgi:hypothetical protein